MELSSPLRPGSRSFPLWARLLSVPVVALVLLAGLWFFAGQVTNGFLASMALAALWFAAAGAGAFLIARRWRPLALPVVATFLLTATAAAGFLAFTSFRDKVVHERVVTASAAAGNIELAHGRFFSGAHH